MPSFEEQRKIVGILSAYDDLIENNKRRIALLEKMAEELYREWFVRFRFPGWQQAEFKKGIPKGWENKRFDNFCTLQRGFDLPDSNIELGEFPVVASTSIKAFHKEFKIKPPIVATGRSGSLGTVQFIQKKAWPLNTCLFVKDFKGNSPYLVYFILKSMRLENFNAGAGIPSLNRNHLAALKLAVPTQVIQQKFDEIISPIFKSLAQQAEVTENLVKTKEALLPRLMSGKLAVENLAVQLPPSMQA